MSPEPTTGPTPTPTTALTSDLGPIEARPDGTVVFHVRPVGSGTGQRHAITVAGSQGTIAWLTVDCRGTGSIEIADGAQTWEVACELAAALTLTLEPSGISRSILITVPASIDHTILLETVPLPATMPELDPLDAPFQVQAETATTTPDWAAPATPVSTVIGTLDAALTFQASYVCLGPGSIDVQFRTPGSPLTDAPIAGLKVACTGEAGVFHASVGFDGPLDLVVTTAAGTAWRAAGASVGTVPEFFPPELRVTAYMGSEVRDAVGQAGVVGCGYTWDLGGSGHTGDQCGPPAWQPMTDVAPLQVQVTDTLHVDQVGSDWELTGTIVRATRAEQLGFLDGEPRDVSTLESTAIGSGLRIATDALSPGRWVVRVDTLGVRASDSFGASYFFLVEVGR